MKKIIYSAESGLVVVNAAPWHRCVKLFRSPSGELQESQEPVSLDQIARAFKTDSPELLVIEWAETEEEFIKRVAAKDVPADAPSWILEESELPADRTFRDAWTIEGGQVVHDMAKARDLQRERMRAARAPKLAALDCEYLRADERADSAAKSAVAQRKQELRDVTKAPAIEAAQTPEDLKAVWPDCLA